MRITILGGTGFIGEYLVRELLSYSTTELNEIVVLRHSDFVREKSRNADLLIYLTQPNPKSMATFLQGLERWASKPRILYLSSLLVYPNSSLPLTEDVPPFPLTEYERAKCDEEGQLFAWSEKAGGEVCVARLANVYGDKKNRGIVQLLMTAVRDGTIFQINGNGDQIRDYIFVEDVARLLSLLAFYEQCESREIFNVSSGYGVSIIDLIAVVEKVIGQKIRYHTGESISEKKSIVGDNRKILNQCAATITFSLEAGLQKTWFNINKAN